MQREREKQVLIIIIVVVEEEDFFTLKRVRVSSPVRSSLADVLSSPELIVIE